MCPTLYLYENNNGSIYIKNEEGFIEAMFESRNTSYRIFLNGLAHLGDTALYDVENKEYLIGSIDQLYSNKE